MVNLTIDNQKVSVPEGTTILNAAKEVGIDIPVSYTHLNEGGQNDQYLQND